MPDPVALPRQYRPFGARIAAGIAAVVLVAAMALLWLMLPSRVRAEFGLAQRATLVAFFAAVLAVLYGMFRTSATADETGLVVTNFYKVRRFHWPEIVQISLSANRPWALLDLADGTAVSVMAIQSSDGDRAVRAARELAGVLAQRSLPS
ncbi:MAG: PH domain-containing protein [Propionibacteriales bacterium]|nr:PH domain-containing protein [Propionibacteriales bacterium]